MNMKHRGSKLLPALTIALALQAGSHALEDASKPSASPEAPCKPAVLFLIKALDPTFREQLEAAGFYVDVDETRAPELTWDKLKQFNVLVLNHWHAGSDSADDKNPPAAFANTTMPTLRRFLENGGGILADFNAYGYLYRSALHYAAAHSMAGEEWGLRVCPQQLHDSAANTASGNSGFVQTRYVYTDDVRESPVTDGVNSLWVATHGNNQLIFGPDWQVVVYGSKTAYTVAASNAFSDEYWKQRTKDNPLFASSPPLFGIRQYKQGRLAAQVEQSMTGYGAGYFSLIGGAQMEKGIGSRRSDYGKLILNTLRWLAAPSANSEVLGGYTPPREESQAAPAESPRYFDWNGAAGRFGAGCSNEYKGVIGLTSDLGGGRSTVAEYAAAAKELGLDFIVFLDPLEKLDAERWEALKKACAQASDDALRVYPGMRFLDDVGNHKFVIGDEFPWPEQYLTAERRMKFRIASGYFFLDSKQPILGIYRRIEDNRIPIPDLRLYNAIGVVTYENGRQVEDNLAEYQLANRQYNDLAPLAIDIVDSREGLKQAAQQGHMMNWVQGLKTETRQPDDRDQFFKGNRGRGYRHFNYAYISQGPRIKAWRLINDTLDSYKAPTLWTPGAQRVRAQFSVESDAPLKEALIYDGDKVVRRFAGKGKTLDEEIEFTHSHQGSYFAVVEDVEGRRAISETCVTVDFHLFDFYCSDRVNSMPLSIMLTMPGGAILYHNYPTMCRGPLWTEWLLPGIAMGDFLPPGEYIDTLGTPPPNSTMLVVKTPEGAEDQWNRLIYRVFTSADVLVKDGVIRYTYETNGPPILNGWHTCLPLVPTKSVEMTYRKTWYRYRGGGAASGLMEGQLAFKRDVTLEKPIRIFAWDNGGNTSPDEYRNYALITPQTTHAGHGSTNIDVSVPFPIGSYGSLFSGRFGSSTHYSLSDNLACNLQVSGNRTTMTLTLGKAGQQVAKGTVWNYRYLGLRGKPYGTGDNREAESFWSAFFGKDGARDIAIRADQGTVGPNRFPIELTAKDGAFVGTVSMTADPGLDLPLLAHGFPEDWSVVLYDDAEKRPPVVGLTESMNKAYCAGRRCRLLGVHDGTAYCSLDAREIKRFAIGYPVTANVRGLVLTLVDKGDGQFSVEAHNPTDQEVKAEIAPAPWFRLAPKRVHKVTIPSASSVIVDLAKTADTPAK